MIQIIILGLFILLTSLDSDACNELNIVCKTVCAHDGDELGIVIKDKCYCANYRSLDKIVIRVPKNGSLVADKKKTNYIWE